MPKIIALTGPSGSGKTTIGEALAKKLDKCVNIDADHIKHMIVSGFYKDDKNPGGWSFSEWDLLGESIGILAKNFQNKGFTVVINGYINEPAWMEIEKLIELTHKYMLLPDIETNKRRDSGRSSEISMGPLAVETHQDYFRNSEYYDVFIKLDTSSQDPAKTLDMIIADLRIS